MLTLLNLLLSFAGSISRYIERKQLMDAGKAQQVSKDLEDALENIAAARRARATARIMRDDPNNRDNQA